MFCCDESTSFSTVLLVNLDPEVFTEASVNASVRKSISMASCKASNCAEYFPWYKKFEAIGNVSVYASLVNLFLVVLRNQA